MGKISVLIAEDHTIVREGLRSLLEASSDILVVGEAENGREAVSLCQKLRPDIVLMDIGMPVLNGVDATRIISKDVPESKVVILSMYTDDEFVQEAVKAGASGYLLKRTASDDLLRAVREVARGRAFLSPAVSKTVLKAYSKASREIKKNQPSHSNLSTREREVLQLIIERYCTEDIAEQLHISTNTVRTHRQNIMKKLDIHDVVGLTRYVIEKKILPGDPS
ncbi:MAG: response regulator [Fidelibacterota bacterium]